MTTPAQTLAALVSLLGVAMVSCVATPAPAPPHGSRPSIVLIMADDLGWGDLGMRGHEVLRTPHLDAMAADGMTFDRFYAAAPVCSPTRGSVLTGRHPFRYGIRGANDGHLPASEVTLAELLRDAGYRTGHFGKWHLGTLTMELIDGRRGGRENEHYAPPWAHGFDECFSTEQAVATWDPMENQFLSVPTRYWTGPGEFATENLRGDDSRVIVDRALPFVEQAVADDVPFFCVIWLHAPHRPVIAGPEFRAPYAGMGEGREHYYGVVEALDQQVGRVRATLADLGVANDTMVWFCSDNGPEGQAADLANPDDTDQGRTGPFRGRKRALYEGGVRVPGFVVWPGSIQAGERTEFPVVTSDYLPTIAELTRVPLPEVTLDGISIVEAIFGDDSRRGGAIGFLHGRRRAWIEDRYKVIGAEGKPLELYDLVADPSETADLAEVEPAIVDRMRGALEAWRNAVLRDAESLD